jgi:hypothetical protein
MMTLAQWRRAMTAGIAFVVLLVVGIFLTFGNSPETTSKQTDATASAKYVTYLSSSGHRVGLIVAAYILIAAAVAFLWFTSALRSLVAGGTAARMISALGLLGAGGLAAGAIIGATPAAIISFGGEPAYSGGVSRALMDLFTPFVLILFGLMCAAIIGVLAVELARSRAVPRWLAYAGWLGVAGAIFAVVFLPFALTLLWFLALAVTGLVRPPVVMADPRPVAPPAAPAVASV